LYELEAESWLNTRSLSYDRIRCILCTSHVFKINIVYIWKSITLLLGGVQFEELCGASPQHSYVVPGMSSSTFFSSDGSQSLLLYSSSFISSPAAHYVPVGETRYSNCRWAHRALWKQNAKQKKSSKPSLQSKFLLQHSIYYDRSSEHENLLNWRCLVYSSNMEYIHILPDQPGWGFYFSSKQHYIYPILGIGTCGTFSKILPTSIYTIRIQEF